MRERTRGPETMTTIVMLTPCVVADSRRLRPPRRSLTSLSFVSSLVLSFLSSDGVSLSTTRVAAVTPSRARACTSDTYDVPSYTFPSNLANPARAILSLSSFRVDRILHFSSERIRGYRARGYRPTIAKAFADAHMGARDRACGYPGFAAAAAVRCRCTCR